MNTAEIIDFVNNRFSYKPDCTIEADVAFGSDNVSARVVRRVPNSYNPEQILPLHSSTYIPVMMVRDEDQLVWLLTSWLRQFEMHELDEWIKVDGVIVNDPHAGQKKFAAYA